MRDFTDEINLSLRGGGDEGSGGRRPLNLSLKYSGNYLVATHFIQLFFSCICFST